MPNAFVARVDKFLIESSRRYAIPFARGAFFLIFFWFGILKIVGASPAIPLVDDLLSVTLPFVSPDAFNVLFGSFEVLIGVLFLFRRFDRVVMPLFALHMLTTMLPLVLLSEATWQSPFVPTLVGQYIIKNVVLVALALAIVARMDRLR